MLLLVALCSAASGSERASLLLEAQLRASSSVRAAFTATVASPSPRPMRLACCLAAEETAAEDDALHLIAANVAAQVEDLANAARQRMALSTLLGTDNSASDAASTATAVSTTLFGSCGPGTRDDEGCEGFFRGSSPDDYYDPRNSFIDCVLARRVGIPITLSLLYCEVCESLGLPMVGLNAPRHLLLAPADPALSFVVDPFAGGRVMSDAEASMLIAQNAGSVSFNPRADSDLAGALLLQQLRAAPMDAHTWSARMLRNLRAIHASSGDVVRLAGAAERLRLISARCPLASPPQEAVACSVQLASCIYALRWEARRDEARALLEDSLATPSNGVLQLAPEVRGRVVEMLNEEWFRAVGEVQA